MSAVLLQGNVSCCRVVCHVCSVVTGECVMLQGSASCLQCCYRGMCHVAGWCVMLQGGVSCLHHCCCRVALEEVKQDLQERLHRWHTMERLCGFPIITNPGLSALHQMLHGTREGPCLLGFPLSSLFPLLLSSLLPFSFSAFLSPPFFLFCFPLSSLFPLLLSSLLPFSSSAFLSPPFFLFCFPLSSLFPLLLSAFLSPSSSFPLSSLFPLLLSSLPFFLSAPSPPFFLFCFPLSSLFPFLLSSLLPFSSSAFLFCFPSPPFFFFCLVWEQGWLWLEPQAHERKVPVRVPTVATGEFSSPGSTFCADSYFGICSTPCVTAVACGRSQSFCQKCRQQGTFKHMYTLPVWL